MGQAPLTCCTANLGCERPPNNDALGRPLTERERALVEKYTNKSKDTPGDFSLPQPIKSQQNDKIFSDLPGQIFTNLDGVRVHDATGGRTVPAQGSLQVDNGSSTSSTHYDDSLREDTAGMLVQENSRIHDVIVFNSNPASAPTNPFEVDNGKTRRFFGADSRKTSRGDDKASGSGSGDERNRFKHCSGEDAVSARAEFSRRPAEGNGLFFNPVCTSRFECILYKGKKRSLGLDVDHKDPRKLLVEEIAENGLIDEWNRLHRNTAVLKGDLIVAVNGLRNSEQMLEECRDQSVLRLEILRCT